MPSNIEILGTISEVKMLTKTHLLFYVKTCQYLNRFNFIVKMIKDLRIKMRLSKCLRVALFRRNILFFIVK